jgi:hypothetical protein
MLVSQVVSGLTAAGFQGSLRANGIELRDFSRVNHSPNIFVFSRARKFSFGKSNIQNEACHG